MWKPYTHKDTAICPVCRTVLGAYDADVTFKVHCNECCATFYFRPNEDKPSVVLDSAKVFSGYCGPDGCMCRD